MKKIAIVGSSGGNLFNLGGKKPYDLLEKIINQAQAAGFEVEDIIFIAAEKSMDQVQETTPASLLTLDRNNISEAITSELREVNEEAEKLDENLAGKIEEEKVDGLVLVSADPEGVNSKTVKAAAEKGIPVAGTGGTSMSTVQSLGANVVSASGTTGTTNRTRAISYITSLSDHWEMDYKPVVGNIQEASTDDLISNINLKSIMVTALPAFIAMALMLALSRVPHLGFLEEDIFETIVEGLPIVVAVIGAKQVSGLDQSAIIAGIITGLLSTEAGILGGLAGGIIAGFLVTQLLSFSYRKKLPATTASIVAGGFAGLIAGSIIFYALTPATSALGEGIRAGIEGAIEVNPILAGAFAGLVIWPAIMGGFYHGAILPVILLEMEEYGHSFFGAVDMSGLVMVSAGITLANIILPRKKGERAVAGPGFFINMAFGTFVEAAYPFMFSSKLVFGGAILASTLAGTSAGIFGVRGTAYVPSLVAPGVSNNPVGFVIAMAVGLVSSFVFTYMANKIALRGERKSRNEQS